MISKKEEERNEKIIRGLMKLPPNRNCINCNSLGPQYVCTNFWTFVCTVCSGIHREFTHRVKSVSMSKFTTQEVDALQKGGNQRAREQYLWELDTRQMRLPNNSNPDKIREFIKSVYVDRKYYTRTTSDKPPRGASGEDDYRKASSYHSFSQSPPYEHQYEERRYGKQAGTLTRKPGSDRGMDGKYSSFLYSPGHQGKIIFENKLANESTGSRRSDFSVSSDPFRSDGQSLDLFARRISPAPQGENAKVQKMDEASQLAAKEDSNKRSALSSGSFGTLDSNSHLSRSANQGSLIDSVFESAPASTTDTAKVDFFNHMPVQTQKTSSTPFIDLFADINQSPLIIPPVEEKPPVIPADSNGGWAFFDLQHTLEPATQSTDIPTIVIEDAPKEIIDLFSSMHSNFDQFSAQKSDSSGQSLLPADQWPIGLNGSISSANTGSTQLWNTLSDPIGSITQPLPAVTIHNNESQDMLHCLPLYVDPYIGFKAPEAKLNDEFLIPPIPARAPAAAGMTSSSFIPPFLPQMGGVPLERKTSFNPFEVEPEANNMFMDMNSLQATLPDPQLPAFPDDSFSNNWFHQDSLASFIPPVPGGKVELSKSAFPDDSFSNNWFHQDSLASFIPPVPEGSLACTGGPLPSQHPQNITSQGSIPPLGGNPFA